MNCGAPRELTDRRESEEDLQGPEAWRGTPRTPEVLFCCVVSSVCLYLFLGVIVCVYLSLVLNMLYLLGNLLGWDLALAPEMAQKKLGMIHRCLMEIKI